MKVYIKVTGDKYELPVAIADTGKELARLVGVEPDTVYSQVSRGENTKGNRLYYKIDIGDPEADDK